MDESTKKSIASNIRMLNSGINLLCEGGRLSADVIENEFKTIEILLNDCKRLMYDAIED